MNGLCLSVGFCQTFQAKDMDSRGNLVVAYQVATREKSDQGLQTYRRLKDPHLLGLAHAVSPDMFRESSLCRTTRRLFTSSSFYSEDRMSEGKGCIVARAYVVLSIGRGLTCFHHLCHLAVGRCEEDHGRCQDERGIHFQRAAFQIYEGYQVISGD